MTAPPTTNSVATSSKLVGRFTRGDLIRCRMTDTGALRSETWRDRWASALAETFWPSGTYTVTAVDRDGGTITIGQAR